MLWMEAMVKNRRFLFVIALFWFSGYIFIPYLTPYLRELGIVGSTAGMILGTYGFSQLLLRVPFGVAANRSGNHKAFMSAGFAALIAAGVLLSFATHPAAFFLARFLAGLASSSWVSFTVFYTGMHTEEETGKAIAAAMIANNSGTLSSYLFGIVLFDKFDIGFMFILSIVSAAAGLTLLCTVKEGDAVMVGSGMNLRDFKNVLKNRGLLIFSSIAALSQIVTYATILSFTPDYVKNNLGADGRGLAFLSVIYSVACILGSAWVSSKYSARIPVKYQIMCSFALSAMYCLIVPNTVNLTLVYVMQLIGGIGQSSIMTHAMALSIGEVHPGGRSAAMGIYQCIYSFGMTLGPIIMGGLLDIFARFNYACYVIILVCAAGMFLSFAAVKVKTLSARV